MFNWIASAAETPEQQRCVGQIRAVTGYVAPDVAQTWRTRFGVEQMNRYTYGQTEGMFLTVTPNQVEDLPPGCVGKICHDFEVQIIDECSRPLPEGEVGEITFRPRRANVMFSGYWGRPADTAKAWADLWMHTGDVGSVKDGHLYFLDRKKDYLRNRGENISSFEVERAYMQHPDIVEAAVYSVGDAAGEGEIMVAAVLRDGATLTPEDLCTWSIGNLPYFAVPRYFDIRDQLAKTPTGKVQKFRLRQEGLGPATWDRVAAGIEVRRN